MRTFRRYSLIWLALLGLFSYGLAPLFQAFTSGSPAPLRCAAPAVHSCACRIDPHGEGECCCATDPSAATRCALSAAPCDGGLDPQGVHWTTWHPLGLPAETVRPLLHVRLILSLPEQRAALRQGHSIPHIPPPRSFLSA